MKRYLVFAGGCYYPIGGWDDFRGDADTIEDARNLTVNHRGKWDWWHIVDTETLTEVDSGPDALDIQPKGI